MSLSCLNKVIKSIVFYCSNITFVYLIIAFNLFDHCFVASRNFVKLFDQGSHQQYFTKAGSDIFLLRHT